MVFLYFDNLYPTAWLGPVVFILVVDVSPPDISSVTLDQDVLCELPSLWGGG